MADQINECERQSRLASEVSLYLETDAHTTSSTMRGYFPYLWRKMNADWHSRLLSAILANWRSGITVALITIPQSISLALSSQATPVMGINTAVWAGLVASLFSESEFMIHGPTGALSGILSIYALTYGTEYLPTLALIAGIMCLVVALLRLDYYIMYIPYAVMEGFTISVATMIAGSQIGFALGLTNQARSGAFYERFITSLAHANEAHVLTFIIFLVSTLLLAFLIRMKPSIPWAVVIAIIAIILGWLADIDVLGQSWKEVATLKSRYGDISPELLVIKGPKWPNPREGESTLAVVGSTLYSAASITFITVLETLISARVIARLTNETFTQSREVISTALANIASGIFGGIPTTAALVRTSLNIKSGAASRASGIIASTMTGIISLLLFPVFRYLMLPVIASILVVTAARMVEYKQLWQMFHSDKTMMLITLCTALVCIVKDPIVGIIVGGIISLFTKGRANIRTHGEAEKGVASKSSKQIDIESTAPNVESFSRGAMSRRLKQRSESCDLELQPPSVGDDSVVGSKFLGELTYLKDGNTSGE